MDGYDSETTSNTSEQDGINDLPFENLPRENQDETQNESVFSTAKIATVNCLHAYAIARMKGAEDNSLPWPPLLLLIIKHLNTKYHRKELNTERNLAMLELLLKVPIQLKIIHSGGTIDLNEDESLDYNGMSFVEAIEILKDLLRDGLISRGCIRNSVPL